jgi:hypothetical protein
VKGLSLFEAAVALCERFHRELLWMLTGTAARPRTANRFASQLRSGREPSRRDGSIPGDGRRIPARPLGWHPVAPEAVPSLTETDRHDPETGNIGRLLGVYLTFGLCFRLRSRIGAHFTSRPDISIAGNNRTFLLRFDISWSGTSGRAKQAG